MVVPPEKKASKWEDQDSTIKGAYIGGVFVLIAAVITGIAGLWQGAFANPTAPSEHPITQQTSQFGGVQDNSGIGSSSSSTVLCQLMVISSANIYVERDINSRILDRLFATAPSLDVLEVRPYLGFPQYNWYRVSFTTFQGTYEGWLYGLGNSVMELSPCPPPP